MMCIFGNTVSSTRKPYFLRQLAGLCVFRNGTHADNMRLDSPMSNILFAMFMPLKKKNHANGFILIENDNMC